MEVIMAISDWPAGERPREKLLTRGARSLSDAELLAIFLRTGVRGVTAVDMARDLLRRFGSLRQLLAADHHRFCEAPGLGDAKYAQLQAVLEMSRRYSSETLQRGAEITSPQAANGYLQAQLGGYPNEVFAALFLDTRHRIICFEELFYGTIDGASVHPREVVRKALRSNAAAVILAHNHPSGVAEPSQADIHITARLKQALGLIDVRVLDHIVVTPDDCVSLAQRGHL
jgi:DNA repair protein RadC